MEAFPDGAPVRLRSRASELFLHADEDGVDVSLSLLRASARTSWNVRRVERDGVCYVAFQSAAGRFLSADPAPPGARALVARQSEDVVVWSVRSAGDGGGDMLMRHSEQGFLCPLGCASGVGVRHRVNGRSSLLPRWSVEAAPVIPPGRAMEEAGGAMEEAAGGGEAPAPGDVQIMEPKEARLRKLYDGMEAKLRCIRDNIDRLHQIETLARTRNYHLDTPIKKVMEEGEEAVVKLVEGYHVTKREAKSLLEDNAGEGAPAPILPVLHDPEEFLTPSIRRRLLRRQLLMEEKTKLF